jgi:hypothetical protein
VQAPAKPTATERFLGGLQDAVAAAVLRQALGSGYQLRAALVPARAAPAVVILAAYARQFLGVELVDSYERLLDVQREAFLEGCQHADKYFVSCICILAQRGEAPSEQSYIDLHIPEVFSELVTTEGEEE